jgi:hypothetical protein
MAEKQNRTCTNRGGNTGNAVYGLGLIGALIYYIQAGVRGVRAVEVPLGLSRAEHASDRSRPGLADR